MNKVNLAVLASGNGSNLQAIIDNCKLDNFPAKVAVVISDQVNAYALERAKTHDIPFYVIERKNFPKRKNFETEIVKQLQRHNVQLVCLAGFMRLIGITFLNAFPNKIINIHPSLLPQFPGLEAQQQAFEANVATSGCTVHFVDEKMDNGPIILQKEVTRKSDDNLESFTKRILAEEHEIYPAAIKLVIEKNLKNDTDLK